MCIEYWLSIDDATSVWRTVYAVPCVDEAGVSSQYRRVAETAAVAEISAVAGWLRACDTLTMFEPKVCGRSWVRSPTGAI